MCRFSFAVVMLLIAMGASAQDMFDRSNFRSLTDDKRARHLGDLVTVMIVEDASAEANNGSAVDGDVAVGVNYSDSTNSESGALRVTAEKQGQSSTNRKGKLTATISALVIEVTEGGHLVLSGSQLITINGEQQRISIQGIARPDDLTRDNVILSSRLADAQIQYDGEGLGDGNHRKGVFVWLLQTLRLI